MSNVYLVTIPDNVQIAADDRLVLKRAIASVVRGTLLCDVPVSIDHLGLPITDIDQEG